MFGSDEGRTRRWPTPTASAAVGRLSTGNKSMMFMNSTQKNTSNAIGATNLDFWWNASLTWPSTNSVQTSTKFCQPFGTPLSARRAIGQNRNTNRRPSKTEKNIESMFTTQKFWEFSTIFQVLRSSWRYVRWCRMYAPLVCGASAAIACEISSILIGRRKSVVETQGQDVGQHRRADAGQRRQQRQFQAHQDQEQHPQHDHPFQQQSDREPRHHRPPSRERRHEYAQRQQRGTERYRHAATQCGQGELDALQK